MLTILHCLIQLLFFKCAFSSTLSITDIVDEETRGPYGGRICAYADLNKDRYTDIIVQFENRLELLIQSETGAFKNDSASYFNPISIGTTDPVFCSIGDFDGDSATDVLVIKRFKAQTNFFGLGGVFHYDVDVYYAHGNNFDKISLGYSFIDHPSVVDINGDGISDIIGFTVDTTDTKDDNSFPFYCRSGDRKRNFNKCEDKFKNFNFSSHPFINFSPIFADIDDDLVSEVIFGFLENEVLTLSTWKLSNEDYYWEELSNFPVKTQDITVGTEDFAGAIVSDFNADARLDILLPVCPNKGCKQISQLLALTYIDKDWKLIVIPIDLKNVELLSPVFFRAGDFSLDGYPDLITSAKVDGKIIPQIIDNVDYSDSLFKRKFEVKTGTNLIQPSEMSRSLIQLVSFFDLKEDGNLDIIVEYQNDKNDKIDFIKCDDKGDTTFLKVQLFTNVCTKNCNNLSYISDSSGSGITWNGACVSFSMTDSNVADGRRFSKSCQVPQTTHRVFHNPYALFGLGRSPNFVDEVTLGVPRWSRNIPESQSHHLTQIVPNSRIIVVPPEGNDTHWMSRLYLTPNRLIIISLIILSSMCGILLILIVFLHYRERRHDLKERMAQTRRFHFVAM